MPSVRAAASTVQATTPVGAPEHGCALGEAAAAVPSGPLSVTSHTLSLSTRAFSVDFTWSRVESDQPSASDRSTTPTRAPAEVKSNTGSTRRQPRPAQSFSEILRRQQLAQLLLVVPPPPPDAVLISSPDPPGPASPGQVCRAYSQAQGPLANSSLLYKA